MTLCYRCKDLINDGDPITTFNLKTDAKGTAGKLCFCTGCTKYMATEGAKL